MKSDKILVKAYQEQDWDTFLDSLNAIIGHVWYASNQKQRLGEAFKDDAFQEVKLEVYQKRDKFKEHLDHIGKYIYRFCWKSMQMFHRKTVNQVYNEGTKREIELDDEGNTMDVEVPFDDKLEPFLDLQLVEDHIASYKSKPFRKAIKLYLEGYTKREAATKCKMWDAGLMAAINVFIVRVKNELTDDYVDEEQYIKESVRPHIITYVRKHTKRRKQ